MCLGTPRSEEQTGQEKADRQNDTYFHNLQILVCRYSYYPMHRGAEAWALPHILLLLYGLLAALGQPVAQLLYVAGDDVGLALGLLCHLNGGLAREHQASYGSGIVCHGDVGIDAVAHHANLLGPQTHLLLETDIEIFVTLLLTMFSSSCVGLLISALFSNGESAILAVLVLMIGQVVFSNVMFTLTGAAATISTVIVCRWGMGALGASTDLNSRMAWLQAGLDGPMYDATVENLTHSWQMLGLISLVSLVAAWLVLQIAFDKKKA